MSGLRLKEGHSDEMVRFEREVEVRNYYQYSALLIIFTLKVLRLEGMFHA